MASHPPDTAILLLAMDGKFFIYLKFLLFISLHVIFFFKKEKNKGIQRGGFKTTMTEQCIVPISDQIGSDMEAIAEDLRALAGAEIRAVNSTRCAARNAAFSGVGERLRRQTEAELAAERAGNCKLIEEHSEVLVENRQLQSDSSTLKVVLPQYEELKHENLILKQKLNTVESHHLSHTKALTSRIHELEMNNKTLQEQHKYNPTTERPAELNSQLEPVSKPLAMITTQLTRRISELEEQLVNYDDMKEQLLLAKDKNKLYKSMIESMEVSSSLIKSTISKGIPEKQLSDDITLPSASKGSCDDSVSSAPTCSNSRSVTSVPLWESETSVTSAPAIGGLQSENMFPFGVPSSADITSAPSVCGVQSINTFPFGVPSSRRSSEGITSAPSVCGVRSVNMFPYAVPSNPSSECDASVPSSRRSSEGIPSAPSVCGVQLYGRPSSQHLSQSSTCVTSIPSFQSQSIHSNSIDSRRSSLSDVKSLKGENSRLRLELDAAQALAAVNKHFIREAEAAKERSAELLQKERDNIAVERNELHQFDVEFNPPSRSQSSESSYSRSSVPTSNGSSVSSIPESLKSHITCCLKKEISKLQSELSVCSSRSSKREQP